MPLKFRGLKQPPFIFVWFLGILLVSGVVFGLPLVKSLEVPILKKAEITAVLSDANVIYLGEQHDRHRDREKQLEIIQALYRRNPRLAIGLEMFQRPYQQYLDAYIAGKITEAELREKTEFDQRWGFSWDSYATIFRFAQAHQIPLLALNTPSEVTRKVARQGLESLNAEEKRFIPPIAEIRVDNLPYRQLVQSVYQQHAHGGHGNSDGFERFFTAQVLWDETMAETIVDYHRANPKDQIVVITGAFHMIYDHGIPSRVERRLSSENLKQYSVLLSGHDDYSAEDSQLPADYFYGNKP